MPARSDRDIAIRPMARRDLDEVIAIERESFVAPWSRGLFEEAVASAISENYVLCDGEKVVGYLMFYRVESESHILNFAIHPGYRKKGYGRFLLAGIIERCSQGGIEDCFLEVREGNYRAIGLYEQCGFRVVGRRKGYYRETKEDALVMHLGMTPDTSADDIAERDNRG